MIDISILATTVLHVVESLAARVAGPARPAPRDGRGDRGDRGAVSLEQVLWFVAAGVIAAILWGQIRDQANTPVDSPSAP